MGPRSGPERLGLGDALFSGVQQRVLGILFGNPDRSFFGNELQRMAGSGKGALRRELNRLEQSGLVTLRAVGNQKHYQANPDSPIFDELRGIAVKTFGAGDIVRQVLLPLADRIDCAFIYGSVAKRTDTARSDIDLMLVSGALAYPDVLKAVQPAEKQLRRKINPTLYSPAELARKRAQKNVFVTRVLEQPKIFLIGAASDLA